ncbi:MAG: hypothetical protein MI923_30155 [Phycisphaerales bacterium]|nr:hypothetical protein [Phycisphaerales bacterium]
MVLGSDLYHRYNRPTASATLDYQEGAFRELVRSILRGFSLFYFRECFACSATGSAGRAAVSRVGSPFTRRANVIDRRLSRRKSHPSHLCLLVSGLPETRARVA